MSANCSFEHLKPGTDQLAHTTAGLYNPLYYLVVGWPSLVLQGDLGIYGMRFAGAIFSSFFLAASVMLITTLTARRGLLIALSIAVSPMVIFLNGMVNPNSVETTATLAVFLGMISLTRNLQERLIFERTFIVTVSAVVAVNMRGLSIAWVMFALAMPIVVAGRHRVSQLLRRIATKIGLVLIASSTSFAVAWLIATNSLSLGSMLPNESPSQLTAVNGFLTVFGGTFTYAKGMIGDFGWLDTPSPQITYFIWSIFLGILIVASLAVLRGKWLLSAGVLIAAVLFIPPTAQAFYASTGGIIWQGRYILPIFTCMVLGLALLISESVPRTETYISPRLALILLAFWVIGQFSAFFIALRRYAVGVDESVFRTVSSPLWSAPGGNITVLLVALALYTAIGGLYYRLLIAKIAFSGYNNLKDQHP